MFRRTFTRGGAYRAKQERDQKESLKLIRNQREMAIKRGENRVVQARRGGGALEDDDELTVGQMFQNVRANMRARRDALKKFQKMRLAEKRRRRRQRWRMRRLRAVKQQRRDLTRRINNDRRRAEQRILSLQRKATQGAASGAYAEGDGVVRVTAESLGFDVDLSADTVQAVSYLPRHNLLLDVHTAPVTALGLATPFVVSGDAIGVVIIWDVVRAVPLKVVDSQPDMPLPPRMTLPMPRLLQEDHSDIKGVVGVVRKRRKLPDGRVITYTAGVDEETVGAGSAGLSASDLGGLRGPATQAAGTRDLAAEAASSSSEDEAELIRRERQRLESMSGRDRAKEKARILEGRVAKRFFLEALTGLPTTLMDDEVDDADQDDEEIAAREIVKSAAKTMSASLPKGVARGPRRPKDADSLWRLDPESLHHGREPGEDAADVKIARRERAAKRRQMRKASALAIADGDISQPKPGGGGDGSDADDEADADPLARADQAARAAREAAKAGERRFPVMSIFIDSRRIAAGLASGEIQMFDLTSLERVATLHPAEMRGEEAVSGNIGKRELRLLRGSLTMDTGKVMAVYNDGRMRRWAIYSGDGDEEAMVEAEGQAGSGGGRKAAQVATRKSGASGATAAAGNPQGQLV